MKKNKVMDQLAEIKALLVLATAKTKLLDLSAEQKGSQAARLNKHDKHDILSTDLGQDEIRTLIKTLIPEAQFFLLSKNSKIAVNTHISAILRRERETGSLEPESGITSADADMTASYGRN